MVGCLNANGNVGDAGLDGLLGPFAGFPAVHLHSVSLVRLEVVVSVLGEPLTEPLTFVQQVHLRPKVEVVLRRGRACELDHPLDVWPHPAQGFEALRAVVLEARRFVQHHHVKRPPPAVVLGQPDQAVSVGYVDVGLFTKGTLSLLCGAQHGARA